MGLFCWLGAGFFVLATMGLAALIAQCVVLRDHLGETEEFPGNLTPDAVGSSGGRCSSFTSARDSRVASGRAATLRIRLAPAHPLPGISILKPLCGLDEELQENIASFAELEHPAYEVLLGVKGPSDPAFQFARAAVERWPDRMRVVTTLRFDEARNPKVNQLIGLAKAARHPLLVVSDSNVRVGRNYLRDIASGMADPGVGLLTHPVAGIGERSLGSLFENLHLAGSVAPGIVAAHRLAHREIVVGKSMAMWKADIEELGGFQSVKDVLAEDHLLGVYVRQRLGKRVMVARRPVLNVNRDRRLRDFWGRYARWSVLQRQILGGPTYAAQLLLNPVLLALVGFALAPGTGSLLGFALVCAAKIATDAGSARALRPGGFPLRQLVLIPVKDLVFGAAELQAFFTDEVEWRGTRLRVLPGSRLAPVEPVEESVAIARA